MTENKDLEKAIAKGVEQAIGNIIVKVLLVFALFPLIVVALAWLIGKV